MKQPTDTRLLSYARQMRHNPTPVEKLLWEKLRNRQLNNLKFRRQVPIGPYIADFACEELKLLIELDGDSHTGHENYDQQRDIYLNEQGYHTIRFPNTEVYANVTGVLETISEHITALTLTLSQRERE